jgi:hypothetical protein
MGLLGNSSRLNFGCGTYMGCTYNYYMNGNREKASYFRTAMSRQGSTTTLPQLANPVGSVNGTAFWQPLIGGSVAMRATGSGTLSGIMIPEKLATVDFTGSGDLDSLAGLVISALCAMTGSGTLTAIVAGEFSASVDFSGDGTLEGDIYGIAQAIVDLVGSGDLEGDVYGIGNASIDIIVTGTGLSIANVGKYVWEAILSEFDSDPNSAAAKLLAAGSAGDPWSTNLPASYTGTQAGAILSEIERLVERLHRIQGLEVGVPSTTDRNTGKWIAGDIDLDLTGDFINQTTVTANT